MFRRRSKRKLTSWIKELMWPSMGWKRSLHYIALRILRLSDAGGHDVLAKSVAWGIGMSFFPIFGIHAVLAAGIAWAAGANVVIAMLATLLMPPMFLPVIFTFDFMIGRQILRELGFPHWSGHEGPEHPIDSSSMDWLAGHFQDFFIPAFTGFLIFLPFAWSAGYLVTHRVMEILRERYQKKHPEVHL